MPLKPTSKTSRKKGCNNFGGLLKVLTVGELGEAGKKTSRRNALLAGSATIHVASRGGLDWIHFDIEEVLLNAWTSILQHL